MISSRSIQAEKVAHLKGHDGAIYTLLPTNNDHYFLSGGSDHMVVLWNELSMMPEAVLAKVPAVIYSLAYFDDYKRLAVGTSAGQIHIIDLALKKEIHCLQPSQSGIFDIQFVPVQSKLLALSGDGSFSLWDTNTLTCIANVKITDKKLRQAAIHPNETTAAVACGNNSIAIIDLSSGLMSKYFEAHTMSVNSLCFSPDGRFLLSGSRDAWLKVWDVQQHFSLHYEVPAHNFAIYSIVYSPDSQFFATASRDKTVKIWNAEDFSFLIRINKDKFDGHINSVNKIIWKKDYLISAGDDRSIMLWKVS
ncbi:MAG: WD40 repeat domain-containing protein [Flavobacteriales bacterium]